jgi:hypothetical protein
MAELLAMTPEELDRLRDPTDPLAAFKEPEALERLVRKSQIQARRIESIDTEVRGNE